VSLAEAREKAFELRRIARSGGNPKVRTREDEGKVTTFEELARQVHERKFKDNANNGKHIAQWIRTLETYAFPTLGNLAVSEIHQDDIEAVLDPIWTSKPETARRVLQRISAVFDFACGRGYRTTGNPATGILGSMRPQRQKPKHFAAMDYHDLPELMKKLASSQVVGALALRFTILTALRSGSVRFAEWGHFDEALTEWTIPGKLMKTGNEFVVPMTKHAREVLLAARGHRTKASPLVFPSPSNPKNRFLKTRCASCSKATSRASQFTGCEPHFGLGRVRMLPLRMMWPRWRWPTQSALRRFKPIIARNSFTNATNYLSNGECGQWAS
jgi:integrase